MCCVRLGCLILIGHFPQKSPVISGSFAKRIRYLAALLRKETCNLRHLMHLRHHVLASTIKLFTFTPQIGLLATHTHAHMHTYVHTHKHIQTYIHTYTHTHTFDSHIIGDYGLAIYIYTHTHSHTLSHTHIHIHTHIHARTHAHPHPHIDQYITCD